MMQTVILALLLVVSGGLAATSVYSVDDLKKEYSGNIVNVNVPNANTADLDFVTAGINTEGSAIFLWTTYSISNADFVQTNMNTDTTIELAARALKSKFNQGTFHIHRTYCSTPALWYYYVSELYSGTPSTAITFFPTLTSCASPTWTEIFFVNTNVLSVDLGYIVG